MKQLIEYLLNAARAPQALLKPRMGAFFTAAGRIFPVHKGVQLLIALVLIGGVSLTPAHAAKSIKILLGSWGGSGTMKLQDGSSERIGCNGYYTGSGSQLSMVIRCTNANQKIEIRSKLSVNANKLSGNWEERTYNATGQINGKISGNRMRLNIGGAVTGTMNVNFSKYRQSINIKTNNIGMSSVQITMKRK